MQPLIIEAAINGMTPKTVNPAVPRSGDEIVVDALACLAAGASIIHCHVEDARLNLPDTVAAYADIFRPVLDKYPEALIYPTWRAFDSAEERHAHMPPLATRGLVRLSYADTGSTNVGTTLDAEGQPSGSNVYINTYDDCRHAFELSRTLRLGTMVAIFEPGFLRVVTAYENAGRLPPGTFVRFYFGGDHDLFTGRPTPINFGMPPTLPCLEAYLDMMGGSSLPWAVAVLGGDVCNTPVGLAAVSRGGHLRVGLEDHAGSRKPDNVELVRAAVDLGMRHGRRPAKPGEAALMLSLPAA